MYHKLIVPATGIGFLSYEGYFVLAIIILAATVIGLLASRYA